jgi:WG containing repeat
VSVGGKYGYIDRSGKMVIPPQFKEAGSFSEGLAIIRLNDKEWGYIDTSGKLVINGEEFGLAREFSEGLAAVTGKNDKYGLTIIAFAPKKLV